MAHDEASSAQFNQVSSASLTTEDLIHPRKASEIPGYNGHTPQLKFNCGHTYGYHTDALTKRYMKNEKLIHTKTDHDFDLKRTYLPKHIGDNKYVEKMVPGYTGYVPGLHFGFGTTYKEGTERAVAKMKFKSQQRTGDIQSLNNKATISPQLKIISTYPPPDISHPGTNLKYATAYYGKKFSDHREFTESPIPGYTGYVPKQMEHELGSTYGNWSGKAYVDSLASKRLQEKTSVQPIQLTRSLPSLSQSGGIGHGNIYKHIGMVPKYTGYVPNRRFEISNTYGDTTRLLPVCYDTHGYSLGRYNHTGPKVKREVIPA
eukprot:Seg3990.1 transcript_id=Seg3990.1/GoldUCD/mRNA.D3Y31 product="Protein FAM166B" protein_id=Seg3990.1/GoldUCD/D3Y31